MTYTTKRPRIKVPADAVRTREQILDGETIARASDGADYVWIACHWCGGSGNFPSSMHPPGRCRFYCWRSRTPETFGKIPVAVEKYVKRAQASDRREYREKVCWEMERPEREARQAREAEERRERELIAAILSQSEARVLAERRHIGTVGERITLPVLVEAVARLEGRGFMGGTRYMVRFRDADDNALVLWTDCPPFGCERDAVVQIAATVKAHGSYQGEAQTVVQRVKCAA